MRGQSAAEPADASSRVEVAEVIAVDTPTQAPPTPPAKPVDQFVLISVETDPPGVGVFVDGAESGVTPIDIKLPRARDPVKVELRQPGFQPTAQEVIPDRDQRLYFSLSRQSKHIVPVKKPPKQQPGFHRFD